MEQQKEKRQRDSLLHGLLGDGEVLVLGAVTTQMAEAARSIHGLSPVATAALGRTMTATAMMAALLKNEGDMITVTLNGGGPLGRIVVVGRPGLAVKGYVENPNAETAFHANGKIDVGAAVGRDGQLTVVKDLGMKEPYVGRAALVSGEIAEDFTKYFALSEQQPSLLSLGVRMTPEGEVLSSGGLLMQPMPQCSEETLCLLEARAADFADISKPISEGVEMEELISSRFPGMTLRMIAREEVAFACDCSQEKVEKALLGMGEAELTDMIQTDHAAELHCHFCNKRYHFDEAALRTLLAGAK